MFVARWRDGQTCMHLAIGANLEPEGSLSIVAAGRVHFASRTTAATPAADAKLVGW